MSGHYSAQPRPHVVADHEKTLNILKIWYNTTPTRFVSNVAE